MNAQDMDAEIERLIMGTKLLGDALANAGQIARSAHAYNAMAALIRARSAEVAAGMDAERLARARA